MSTREIVLFALSIAVLVFLLVRYRRWESKRLKQRTLEAMSPGLRSEIEEEKRVNLEKKRKFLEAMNKASGGGNP